MSTLRKILEEKGQTFFYIAPDDSLRKAVGRLAEHRSGSLLVMDGERLCGIFSERDFVRHAATANPLDMNRPVSDVMTSKVVGLGPETTLDACMALMTERRFRHVPVMKDGMVVGVVSMGDIVKAKLADSESLIKGMEVLIANQELRT